MDRLPWLPDRETVAPWEKGLFKFIGPYFNRYLSVFYLSDGSFVQDTPNGYAPDGTLVPNTNCNVPYPWITDGAANAPYATSVFYDVSITPPPMVIEYSTHTVWVVSWINKVTKVTSAMATALTAAGYGACIS